MLDSGSNTSFISKNVVKKLGIRGPKRKSEASEFLDITVVSNSEPGFQKSMRAYQIKSHASQLEQSRERH